MWRLVIAIPTRKSRLTLTYTEFAKSCNVPDRVVASAIDIALSGGKRPPFLASAEPVRRKTQLAGCFGNAVGTGSSLHNPTLQGVDLS
jgi:hypothetical protein